MFEPDDEPLLAPRGPSADPALRDRLLRQTAGVIRRGVWLRRAGAAAALAACYAAGMISLAVLRPDPEPVTVEVVRVVRIEVPIPAAPPSPEPPALAARDLEARAEQLARDESARWFRRAGDRYFGDEANYDAALRCYRNYLDAAPAEELAPAPADDNWLLLALKNARLKERANANRDG